MKYHALFVIVEKKAKFEIVCRLLQIVGGALRVNNAMFAVHKCILLQVNLGKIPW